MKPSEILRKAADLIEPEGAWTQGDYARRADGSGDYGYEPDVVCWCISGAIQAVTKSTNECRYLGHIARIVGDGPVHWNDAPERTQAEVVKALRDAAALAEAEGQ